MTKTELKEFLDAKVIQYNNPKFIESDPIQISHHFKRIFIEIQHPLITKKHVSHPAKGSVAKRINMFIHSNKVV